MNSVFTSENILPFFAAFDIDCVSTLPSRHKLDHDLSGHSEFVPRLDLLRDPILHGKLDQWATSTAQIFKAAPSVEELDPHFKEDVQKTLDELTFFEPQAILIGSNAAAICHAAALKLGVPDLLISLHLSIISRSRLGYGAPRFPEWLAFVNMLCFRYEAMRRLQKLQALDDVFNELYGFKVWEMITFEAFWYNVQNCPSPWIVCAMPRRACFALHTDLPQPLACTGYLVLEADKQLQGAASSMFGDEDMRHRIESFIRAGDAPIYIGWGSMTCKSKEHMVVLACSAVMAAERRAVVLGGWPGLCHEVLQAVRPVCTEIINYAKEHILFVPKAPHEWLFSRCACIVHHGGAGTTATALRAGVPSVVTPVSFDQFDHAEMVGALGVGLGMQSLESLSHEELCEAIMHVCTNVEMKRRAAMLGKQLRAEDGVGSAVQQIEKIIAMHERCEFRTFVQCCRLRTMNCEQGTAMGVCCSNT